MPAVSALWEMEVETEAQKFKIITIENSEGYKRPCLKSKTKLLSNRSYLVPLLSLPGVIRATAQQEPALGLVREVIPWFQRSWHGRLHWTTPHGFLAALLGSPSPLPRVTWHDSAVCLSPAHLMFVSNPKSSAAANTTSLSPIGRGKMHCKANCVSSHRSLAPGGSRLGKRTAGVLQGTPPLSATASFSRGFLQAKLQGSDEESGYRLGEGIYFAYFSETRSE